MNDTPTWHKSTYSAGGGNCVEVAEGSRTLMRDTQNRDLGALGFSTQAWTDLLGTLSRGE